MDFRESIKKLEPYLALMIFIVLLSLAILLYQDNQLKKEINKNCGWGESDFYCFCEKSKAMEMKNMFEDTSGGEINISLLENVPMDR